MQVERASTSSTLSWAARGVRAQSTSQLKETSQLDFAIAVSGGLRTNPRRIPSRFLYDARGSLLFEMITRQPEYYLTSTESAILAVSAARIRQLCGPAALLELGSGNSEKTEHLLRAWLSRDGTARYVPIDVSQSALRHARKAIIRRHPEVQVVPLNCGYEAAFPLIIEASPAVVVFLGSTVGNLDEAEMDGFLTLLVKSLAPGDFFLVGVDLVKSPEIIDAAYNDAAGVSEEFTRNVFVRMNAELGSRIDTESIIHDARYNTKRERVEIYGKFTSDQTIRVAPLGEKFQIREGESIRTEISRKFRLQTLVPYLGSHGLRTLEIFTDPKKWFALVLLQK